MSNEKKPVIDPWTADALEPEAQPISPLVQEEIGRRLRAVYGRIAAEPLPDKFIKLLNQLSEIADGEDTDPEVRQ